MTAKQPAFLIQGNNIILVLNDKSYTVSKDTHVSYTKIVEALKNKDWESLEDLVEPKKVILKYGAGNISIDGSNLYWKGEIFHNALSSRMIQMYQDGFPIDPMVRFMENLMKNPSKRSVDQLYGFLEKNKLPITEDGCFLAYKKVNDNYFDIYTGKIDNSIGQVVTMERNFVNDNPNQTCSTGLHFCSESYLGSFGKKTNPVMILKINPADVVSIPTDYNDSKGRCCKYEVVGKVSGKIEDSLVKIVNNDFSNKETVEAEVTPAKAWPFPTNASENKLSKSKTKLYDLVRVSNGVTEYYGLTEKDALAKIDANKRQKKANLKMVPQVA